MRTSPGAPRLGDLELLDLPKRPPVLAHQPPGPERAVRPSKLTRGSSYAARQGRSVVISVAADVRRTNRPGLSRAGAKAEPPAPSNF